MKPDGTDSADTDQDELMARVIPLRRRAEKPPEPQPTDERHPSRDAPSRQARSVWDPPLGEPQLRRRQTPAAAAPGTPSAPSSPCSYRPRFWTRDHDCCRNSRRNRRRRIRARPCRVPTRPVRGRISVSRGPLAHRHANRRTAQRPEKCSVAADAASQFVGSQSATHTGHGEPCPSRQAEHAGCHPDDRDCPSHLPVKRRRAARSRDYPCSSAERLRVVRSAGHVRLEGVRDRALARIVDSDCHLVAKLSVASIASSMRRASRSMRLAVRSIVSIWADSAHEAR